MTDPRKEAIERLSQYITDQVKSKIIEKSIFNSTISIATKCGILRSWENAKFVRIYSDTIGMLLSNLDPVSGVGNTYLLKLIEDTSQEELERINIATMSREQIFPSRWEKIIQSKDRRERKTYEFTTKGSDSYRCKRCGARKTSSDFQQTRGSDEPMTQYVTCLNCGAQWKM